MTAREHPDDDPSFGIIGMADSGLSDVSERHDHYLVEDEIAGWRDAERRYQIRVQDGAR